MDIDRPPDIVVLAGGAPVARALVSSDTFVVAADAGVELALSLGLDIDLAVGDFDSLDPALVARIDELAADVHRYPADKDQTDLELALEFAARSTSARVLVAGIEGGRPDHALANLLLIASDRFDAIEIEMVLDRGRGWVVRDRLLGSAPAGTLLSLVPVHGPANVSMGGVRWPLDHERLTPGTTRGVSNQVVDGRFRVDVHDGTVICIIPTNHPEVQR